MRKRHNGIRSFQQHRSDGTSPYRALLTPHSHRNVSSIAPTSSLPTGTWWLQYDIIMTATRVSAKYAPAHREELTWEPRSSSCLKLNWIPWRSLSCPSLFPLCSVSVQPREERDPLRCATEQVLVPPHPPKHFQILKWNYYYWQRPITTNTSDPNGANQDSCLPFAPVFLKKKKERRKRR